MTPNDPSPPAKAPAPYAEPPVAQLTLVLKNESTVQGIQYFSVFPPALAVVPNQPQTVMPMVSTATNNNTQPTATLKWPAPPTMSLFALQDGEGIGAATPTVVTLGSTVAISWKVDTFAIAVTPGAGTTVRLTFDPAIPPGSRVGVTVGPGPILMPIVGDGLTLTPSLTPNYTVQFGTPWQGGSVDFKDVSVLAPVAFKGNTAMVVVGSDNLIVQKDSALNPPDD